MDGSPEQRKQIGSQLEQIKTRMPGVYAAIKAKAEAIGNQAYTLVRQGCGGQANRFYAFEGGRVVGTPFDQVVMAEIAVQMVQFGATFLVIWPADDKGGERGAH